MSAEQVALDHYGQRQQMVQAAADVAAEAWNQVDPTAINASWQEQAPRLTLVVAGAQQAGAADASKYLNDVLTEQGINPVAAGEVQPQAFSGIASDGRGLASLLSQPAITALTALQGGHAAEQALAAGLATLDMIVRTQVADAGRAADQVALTSSRYVDGWVRMVVGKTCSRCLILAGKWYSWNAGFDRHPRCDCTAIPASEDAAGDLRTDPRLYFRSLSRADQDKIFTKAGAEAIRQGSDIGQIVNARRGMSTAGESRTRINADGLVVNERHRTRAGDSTTEGATRRGFAGQRLGAPKGGRAIRLMPEQILREANGDRDEAVRLLRLHGYLI